MKILYAIKHLSIDELIISQSLEALGHKVTPIKESKLVRKIQDKNPEFDFDFVLFHHSKILEHICKIPLPKFFWFFDLVGVPDDIDEAEARLKQVYLSILISNYGFCTDGNIIRLNPQKVSRLVQGCHGLGIGDGDRKYDLLFAGAITPNRKEFIDDLKNKYSMEIRSGGRRLFGKDYADLIAEAKIIIAPDSPIRHNYWSNRVYTVCGFGGFLLHPYIEELTTHYEDKKEIVYYRSVEELYDLIDYYLDHPEEREVIMNNAVERTKKEHTYLHRCKVLMAEIEKHL